MSLPVRAEYIMLTTVARLRMPMRALVSEYRRDILGFRFPEFSIAEIAIILDSLFQRGDLLGQVHERFQSVGEPFRPARDVIETALTGGPNLYYWLTPQGGRRWEELAQPQWHRYVDRSVGSDPNEGEIIAATRERVDENLLHWDDLWQKSHPIVPGTVVRDILEPWDATYWKRLPIGWRARFEVQWVNVTPPHPTSEQFIDWKRDKRRADRWRRDNDTWFQLPV